MPLDLSELPDHSIVEMDMHGTEKGCLCGEREKTRRKCMQIQLWPVITFSSVSRMECIVINTSLLSHQLQI